MPFTVSISFMTITSSGEVYIFERILRPVISMQHFVSATFWFYYISDTTAAFTSQQLAFFPLCLKFLLSSFYRASAQTP